MPQFLVPVDLNKNELRQAVMQNLAAAPGTPVKGQVYYDTTGNILYWYNGSGWVAAQGGAGAVPATTVTTETVADVGQVGSATTYAREDHRHPMPATYPPSGAAGGDLTGSTYPNPVINNGVVSYAKIQNVAATRLLGNPTGAAAAPSEITLGADHAFSGAALQLGAFTGDVTKSAASLATIVTRINGTALSSLATGLLKNTTGTGVPTIAVAADIPTVAAGATGALSATDATTTNARTPSGAASGDLSGTYPGPTVFRLNGTSLASLATGLLKNTTGTGVPTVAVAADVPVVAAGTSATGPMSALSRLDQIATAGLATASVNVNNQKIVNLLDPSNPQDAATKVYVDGLIQGLDAAASCHAGTTANIANLATGAPNTLDGVTLGAGDRVLVKDQTTAAQNGVYTVTTVGTGANGVWTRASDMSAWANVPNTYVWVEMGTANGDTAWVCTSDPGGTLNTTAITWVLFASAGTIIAGTGLTKTGNSIDLVAGDTSLTVAADSVVVNTAVIATVASVTTATAGMAKKATCVPAALAGSVAYATGEVITHNLNTRDVHVMVVNNASPWNAIEVDWEATSLNTVTIRYNSNVINPVGYRPVVMG